MREGWIYKKLGEVCEIVGGSTPKTNIAEYWEGDNMWVTPAELNGEKYFHHTERTISDAAVKSAHLQLLPVGTVLLSSRAPIGKVAITTSPMYCNQGFKNAICSDVVKNDFVYWFLLYSKESLQALGTGATFKEISKKTVSEFSIPLPPLTTQQQIVSELDLLSHILDQKRQQLKEYDALAESIFYDMFGDPVENPKGWEKKTLGEISMFRRGSFPQPYGEQKWYGGDDSMPFVQVADMQDEDFELSFPTKKQISIIAQPMSVFVPTGTVLVSLQGSIGKVSISQFDCYVDRTVAIFYQIAESLCTKIFFAYIIKYIFAEKRKKARGISIKTITKEEFTAFDCLLPPLSLQRSFAAKIRSIEHQKQLLRASIKETERLFQSRMDYWFNG